LLLPGQLTAQIFISNTQTECWKSDRKYCKPVSLPARFDERSRVSGWPFGKQSNGTVFSSKTEGYFTNNSIQLAVANLTALKNTYTGGGNGKGISDYLVSLNKATLNNDILAQFDLAIAKLSLIPDPLSASLTSQPTVVENAYKEIQKLLTLMKTDLASATAVQINYMDNDGD
jgi:predicted lipoprotein